MMEQAPFSRRGSVFGSAGMPVARVLGLSGLVAVALLAGAGSQRALAQNCKPGSGGVPGTLAAPQGCRPPAAKAKPEPKKAQQPDGFWSGVHIGGSVSTTTTIRAR
jgi:hypothetical protein